MAVNLTEPGELLAVSGVTLAAASARVKVSANPGAVAESQSDQLANQIEARNDVAVIAFAANTAVAGVFTQSGFAAPPVQLCRERLAAGHAIRALIVNSGNANAATGDRGLQDAKELCAGVASALDIEPESVLPFSTGVIGEFLPVQRMREGFAECVAALTSVRTDSGCMGAGADTQWLDAARAIMTTDTLPKAVSRCRTVDGHKVTITGTAKGAGMMRPDMATMLAFIACDATVTEPCLKVLVREVADASFNRLSVDGDTSTNDSFVLACTGSAGIGAVSSTDEAHYLELRDALIDVATELAQAIVRDGEGATKFVTVEVNGGRTQRECAEVAFTVAHSPLVKTAIFAGDPNWGRFCMAIGRAGLKNFDQLKVTLHLDDVCIARDGLVAQDYSEAAAAAVMARDEYLVQIDLGRGAASDRVWTSDLSYEYVRVNAEYRT